MQHPLTIDHALGNRNRPSHCFKKMNKTKQRACTSGKWQNEANVTTVPGGTGAAVWCLLASLRSLGWFGLPASQKLAVSLDKVVRVADVASIKLHHPRKLCGRELHRVTAHVQHQQPLPAKRSHESIEC